MECSTASGAYSRTLDDLCKAGYVMRDDGLNPLTCKKIKRARFRVSDNFVRFYLHCIEPRREAVARGLFQFSSVEQLPGLHAFYGLQFENLVLNHINDLFPLRDREIAGPFGVSIRPGADKATARMSDRSADPDAAHVDCR